MSEAEWRSSIYDGIGCSLERGDDLLLLYVVDHGAIAKVGGEIRRLNGRETGFARRGDRYEGKGLIVEIIRRERGHDTATVVVRSEGKRQTFEGRWGCGS
jgi:hypothetical protein